MTTTAPDPSSPGGRRRSRPALMVALGVVLLALLLPLPLLLPLHAPPSWLVSTLVHVLPVGAGVVLLVVAVRAHRRERRRRAFGNRVCPSCEYVLAGLAPEGRCPECGRPFTVHEVQAHWERLEDRARGERPNPYRDDAP